MPDFCADCGSLLLPADDVWTCPQCGSKEEKETPNQSQPDGGTKMSTNPSGTDLEQLPTTDSGSVRKLDAMKWLDGLESPTEEELRSVVTPKPSSHSGSTYATDISNIRVTGDPQFIETIAGLFQFIGDMETNHTRVEINLQQIADRDTDELTDNYALYLSVAERG